jgi:uncharacterized membrane protein YcaP (DUF421 family)
LPPVVVNAVAPFAAVDWLGSSWSDVGTVIVSAVLVLLTVIALIRLTGLRALSKMSAFDFTVTVAIGSILGSSVASTTPVLDAGVAVASLLGLQWSIAQFRRWRVGARIVDNEPLLLMRDGRYIDTALASSRVTVNDVRAKLRQANVANLDEVRVVVLETTGDISVIHGTTQPAAELLADVRGAT